MEPIFVIGRQHSGNTMLATVLGNAPGALGVTGEGGFFEIRRALDRLPPEERAERTARRIRDDGVRAYLRDESTPAGMRIWKEITPRLEAAARAGASATDLYVVGMQEVLRHTGKARWVQKATSYIFLAREVLETFPRARLVYIARNPLDLAASTRKRTPAHRGTLRLVLGWNRGVKTALRLQARHPERFRIVRYEDLVREPEATVRSLCAFCDLPFDPGCLDVPHVNRSEKPYARTSERRGVSASRVYYYREILSPDEERAVRLLASRRALSSLYPQLVDPPESSSLAETLGAVGLLARSGVQLTWEEGRGLSKAPVRTGKRIADRM